MCLGQHEFTHTRAAGQDHPTEDFLELGDERANPEMLTEEQALESAHMYARYAKALWFQIPLDSY